MSLSGFERLEHIYSTLPRRSPDVRHLRHSGFGTGSEPRAHADHAYVTYATCHMSCQVPHVTTCHMSRVTCHVSHVACHSVMHMSHVTCCVTCHVPATRHRYRVKCHMSCVPRTCSRARLQRAAPLLRPRVGVSRAAAPDAARRPRCRRCRRSRSLSCAYPLSIGSGERGLRMRGVAFHLVRALLFRAKPKLLRAQLGLNGFKRFQARSDTNQGRRQLRVQFATLLSRTHLDCATTRARR